MKTSPPAMQDESLVLSRSLTNCAQIFDSDRQRLRQRINLNIDRVVPIQARGWIYRSIG